MDFLSIVNWTSEIKDFYLSNEFNVNFILTALISFGLTFGAIPKIIRVSYRKHLMDVPGERSSHVKRIPNLGGLAIFYAVCIASTIFAHNLFNEYIFLIASLVILMFIGLMDDILVVSPEKKLYAQLVSAFLIVVGSDVRIGNFFNVMGIEQIPYWLSVIFTITVFILLINAYNLIDGIDGLAGSVGIIACFGFIYSFYRLEVPDLAILAVSLAASLLGFLIFNFSDRMKIMMGDTGSMIVGFLLTFMVIKFLNLLMLETSSGRLYYHLPAAPAIAIALFIIPIIDTITVILIRLLQKKHPLQADKNHLHHRFLKLNLSHKKVTAILASFNIFILVITYVLRRLDVNILGAIVLLLGLLFSIFPYLINTLKTQKV